MRMATPSIWLVQGLPWWLSAEESAFQCRGRGFHPWSGRDPTSCGAMKAKLLLLSSCPLEPTAVTKDAACHSEGPMCCNWDLTSRIKEQRNHLFFFLKKDYLFIRMKQKIKIIPRQHLPRIKLLARLPDLHFTLGHGDRTEVGTGKPPCCSGSTFSGLSPKTCLSEWLRREGLHAVHLPADPWVTVSHTPCEPPFISCPMMFASEMLEEIRHPATVSSAVCSTARVSN